MCSGMGWRKKKKSSSRQEEWIDEHLELFGNEMAVQVFRELVKPSPKEDGEEVELEGSAAWMA